MFLEYVFMIILSLLKAVLCNSSQGCLPLNGNPENINKKLVGHTFFTTTAHLHDCVRFCMYLTACKSLNYDFSTSTCDFNDIEVLAADTTPIVPQPKTVLTDISYWPSEIGGKCSGRLCSSQQICIPTTQHYQCMDIDCGAVPTIIDGLVELVVPGQSFLLDEAVVVCTGGGTPSQDRIKCLLPGDLMDMSCELNTAGTPCSMEAKWEIPECPNFQCVSLADYVGQLDVTSLGFTCQVWVAQEPHAHSYANITKHPDGRNDHNYCRSLGYSFLWCYTIDPDQRWDTCTNPPEVC